MPFSPGPLLRRQHPRVVARALAFGVDIAYESFKLSFLEVARPRALHRREYVKLVDSFFSIPFPLASLLRFTTDGQDLKVGKTVAVLELIRWKMIQHLQNNGAGEEKREKDMVEELLHAEGGSFSEEVILDYCLSLLVASYETTSVIMTLDVKFIPETPAALAQLKESRKSMTISEK